MPRKLIDRATGLEATEPELLASIGDRLDSIATMFESVTIDRIDIEDVRHNVEVAKKAKNDLFRALAQLAAAEREFNTAQQKMRGHDAKQLTEVTSLLALIDAIPRLKRA